MNAAALFLEECRFDCLVFHDVDTVCSPHNNMTYRCPTGAKHTHTHARTACAHIHVRTPHSFILPNTHWPAALFIAP